jgi:hypothetical protein
MLSEYAGIMFPSGARASSVDHFGGGSLSSVFLVGGTGIILGVLALLGIDAMTLTSIALIGFGTALVLSSRAVWHLYTIKHAMMMKGEEEAVPGSEFLAAKWPRVRQESRHSPDLLLSYLAFSRLPERQQTL